MKKLISILTAAAISAGCALGFAPAVLAGRSVTLGDVNSDGAVNARDSLFLKMYLAKSQIEIDLDAADTNRDCNITSADAVLLRSGIACLTELGTIDSDRSTVARLTVAGDDISGSTVVVSDPDNANMCFAAEELSKYVEKAAGAALPIAYGTTDSDRRIVLAADSGGVMGDDGFSITVNGGCLTITGGAKRGTMYGVYELLEKYVGYRFYGYDEEYLSAALTVDIPEGTCDVQIPSVDCRCNCITPYRNSYTYSATVKRKLNGSTDCGSMLQAKYGYGIERLLCNAHSFSTFIPAEEYGRDYPCLSDSLSYDICLRNMCALLDERIAAGGVIGDSITQISCSYSADNKFCTCRYCSKVYNEEGSHAGILVRFVNKIDDALTAKYPGITVITNAYNIIRVPPKVSVLNDDVVLLYCWNGCANHKIGSGECSEKGNSLGTSNIKEESYYLGWAEHCSQIYVWYYPTNIYYLLCPQPNLFNLYNDFQWFLAHKAVGFYVVGTSGAAFEDMIAYLISELMWNQNMTETEYSELMKQYMKDHYGPGWNYIYSYAEMMTEAGDLKGCVMNDFEQPFDTYPKEYLAENFDAMKSLFDSAAAAAVTDAQRAAVRRLSTHMYFLGYSATYERDYVNGSEDKRAEFAEGWRDLYDYINDNSIPSTYSTNGIKAEFTLEKSPMMLVYGIVGER